MEMGATNKAGMYKYNFPSGLEDEDFNVLVDVSHVLSSYRGQGLGQSFLGGEISVQDTDGTVSYTGYGTYDNVS